jgi:putative flippase GtrA
LNPFPVIGEIIRILPDALLWGVGLFSIITSSYSFGLFFVSLLESVGIYYGIRSFNSWLGIIPDYVSSNASLLSCRSGFSSVTLHTLSLFGLDRQLAFPSAPIYIVSVAVSYILSMLITFKKDLETLGTAFASRLYLSAIGLSSILFLLMAYRAFNSCDSFMVIIASLIIGLAIGAVLLQQNKLLFGPGGINMLGIPLLYNSTANGNPLYVCNQVAS